MNGVLLHSSDPRTPAPTVYIDFGLQRPAPGQPASEKPGPTAPATASTDSAKHEPLPEGLHPAAESEESMEREIFSQHIERNEYSNFKLRSETRAIECLYAVIQRMAADQHTLFQNTLETPRRMTQEFQRLIESMGEAMKSFHTMIELQNTAMQAIQKQVELARVPPPPPPPPDYVGLGKALLGIIRDLGMKAMDSGYGRRSLPSRKVEELPEIQDAEVSEPRRPSPPAGAPTVSQGSAPPEAPNSPEESVQEDSSDELRRVLTRMSEVDIAQAFSGPEGFKEFLTNIRREIDEGRAQATSKRTPVQTSTPASASTPASQTTPRPADQTPLASGKTPLPPSSQTSVVPSTRTPQSGSAQTPRALAQAQARPGSRPPHGAKRR